MAVDAPPRVAARHSDPLFGDLGPEPPLEYRRMSFDEYLKLPEKPKSEWIDGVAVIRLVPAQFVHAYQAGRIFSLLVASFPSLQVATDAPLHINKRMFVPDIMATDPKTYRDKWIKDAPIIVVEVLSPSTRRYDLTTKLAAYLEAGVGQYWTVDTDRGEIVVRKNNGKTWQELAKLDAAHPTITIDVPPYGDITLKRTALFG